MKMLKMATFNVYKKISAKLKFHLDALTMILKKSKSKRVKSQTLFLSIFQDIMSH